jgi:hypothetical protein
MIAAALLLLTAAYLCCGLVFAIPFVIAGVGRCDPHARHGSWGFRLLILPGTTALWPMLLKRWIKGALPPVERNAHRLLSKRDSASVASGSGPGKSATSDNRMEQM